MILKNLPSQISSFEDRLAALKGKYLQEGYDSHSGCEHLNGRFILKYIDRKSRLGLQYSRSTREIYFPFWKTSGAEMLGLGLQLSEEEAAQVGGCVGRSCPSCSPCSAAHWVGARNKDRRMASRSGPQPHKALRAVLSSWTKRWFSAITSLRRCYCWSRLHLHKSNFLTM